MLTLDDVLSIRHPDAPRWSPDGRRLAYPYFVNGVQELWSVPADGGDPARVSLEGQQVGAWDWSPDGRVAYTVKTQVWVARPGRETAGGAPEALLDGVAPVVDVRWSPAVPDLAILRGETLLILDRNGRVREIALDGEGRGPLAWSPDGRHLALAVREGRKTNMRVIRVATGETVWRTRTDKTEGSPAWAGDERLVFLREPSDASYYEWVLADIGSGRETVLEREADPRGVWPTVAAAASPRGVAVALTVPVDGWNHVVLHDLAAGTRRVVLPGEHEDYGHAGDRPDFSPDGRRLIFSSSRGRLQERHIWMFDRDTGEVRQITSEPGTQVNGVWSPDCTRVAYITCGPRHSAEVAVVSLDGRAEPGGERRLTCSMPETWTPGEIVEPSHVTLASAGGLHIHADLFVPRGLDTSKRHPALVYVHGGPVRQMRYGWHPMRPYAVFYSFNQYLIQQGYVVLSVDYRGGTGYGVEYERANYLQMAQGDVEDCVAAARYLASLPYVDPERIGIWGLSYGGYMTLACLTKRPGVFAMGINIAGLWDAEQWARWVEEQSPGAPNVLAIRAGLGDPVANAEAVRQASPRHFVEGLSAPLLNLHGTADKNVDFAQMDRIIEDCVAHGKDFAALYYPGESHMFTKRETWEDAFSRMLAAFDRYLKCEPGARPRAMI